MKRVLSGIKPSGQLTLGNYLGAMKRWAENQDGTENFFFIPNLHALTIRQDPNILLANTYNAVRWLLSLGVDPSKSTIFLQSQVSAHSELSWILNNYTTMGELNRMTQYKDKLAKLGGGAGLSVSDTRFSPRPDTSGLLVGIFDYPVLMAADILLYDADEVPVGEDQVQHIELTRDIATRFNNLYGRTFEIPKATLPRLGARIMNLQDPSSKMSKSDFDDSGNILMSDGHEAIRNKIMKAVTDSGSSVRASDDKPAITNLLQIFSLIDGRSIEKLEEDFAGKGYGEFKKQLADAVVGHVEEVQSRFNEFDTGNGKDQIKEVLETGRQKASAIADKKLDEVKTKLGLL